LSRTNHGTGEIALARRSRRQGWMQRQQRLGIDIDALPAHSKMQMRRRNAPRVSAQTQNRAALNFVAFFHFNFGEMEVKGQQALTVIDEDTIALEIKIAG